MSASPTPSALRRAARVHSIAIRAQIESLRTVMPGDPKLEGAKQLTRPYRLRQIDQCEALLKVVEDMAGREMILVKAGNEIVVWVGVRA